QRNEIMYVVSVSVNKFLKHFTRQPRSEHFSPSKPTTTPLLPASFAFVESRRNGILVTGAAIRKGSAQEIIDV
ncbi:hypothetical protein, partial [Caballeronia sp. GAWG1-5s-s]|uniref:hypothetical protein n=1 Tax=Caballeronia sp. GAWG1-5s-s TaxID=2921743 RepID=UPI0020286611